MTGEGRNAEGRHPGAEVEAAPSNSDEVAEPAAERITRRQFAHRVSLAAAAGRLGPLLREMSPVSAEVAPIVKKPTLYLIATAHNDTQWNWTVQHTIRDCVPDTMRKNFALFEKFPDYHFNYEGVIHYRFFKEYQPDEWRTLQDYVAKGRWRLSGSWINAIDVNVPSPESLFRHALYGNGFFRREFGQTSRDVYLPDCFGFGFALPTIARHSGLNTFSTQKLSWGSWIPAPFPVGRWEGVDGSFVVASLKCGAYVSKIRTDPSVDPKWTSEMSSAGDTRVNVRYFGVGDQGGAPDDLSVEWAMKGVHHEDAPVRVLNTSVDQITKDLTDAEVAALPHYRGELIMRLHGTGCYTSQAAMKKWNRANELMGDAAERACVAAEWLGGPRYPGQKLADAWVRVLWHQAHDDVTGTCIPQAYTFSWNDELIALNQFSHSLTVGVGAIASGLDTRVQGIPVVIYNPTSFDRREAVEATVRFEGGAPAAVRGYRASDGKETLIQELSRDGESIRLLILADAPSVGAAVYEVRPAEASVGVGTSVKVSESGIENNRYRVTVDGDGNVSSVFDKEARHELLQAPARIVLFDDPSPSKPAWQILWSTTNSRPRTSLKLPTVKVVEAGPVRGAIEVTRSEGGSTFVQRIQLVEGGNVVEFDTRVDWKTPGTLVKAVFPFAASNPNGVFDLGVGVIERPNATANRYEVPAQQWAGITDRAGGFGAAVVNDCKYGWDKPSDNTLRLTLLHTPIPGGSWYQGTQDIGKHHFRYGLTGHQGDWRDGRVPQVAEAFNQPLRAFTCPKHSGTLGREFSFLRVSDPSVAVRALKKAEEGFDLAVVRLQETAGREARNVFVQLPALVIGCREINAAEELVREYPVHNGGIWVDLKPFQPRTFALRVDPPETRATMIIEESIPLPYNLDAFSLDTDRGDGDFDGAGRTYPGELVPERMVIDGIDFRLGSSQPGQKNALTCEGQTLPLPGSPYNRIYLLAAAAGDDAEGEFAFSGGRELGRVRLKVQGWTGLIGQWWSTLEMKGDDGGEQVVVLDRKTREIQGLSDLKPAFLKPDPIAWVCTHRHQKAGNEANLFCYLFLYVLDLPTHARMLTLPNEPRIRIFAASAALNPASETVPAAPLIDV